ncbi:LacI family transcriptional regulator [Kribbella antibiotica]|uniref:LacI family transcriptional regulator n=1 Tax=Kribbella antibiotica TaxID=190195 RepID=A0A4R4ZR91_9ACTN|nr:LacI family DNA-binding transcriptional regulator [Kribbella antibiotica]TDD60726.1 LacI family transcriptional regulator [Kribbella antibiotica]
MPATLRDVARLAGVSPSTVSRALSLPDMVGETTRARVKIAVEQLHYQPNRAARGLITGRTGNVGLVIPDLANPFFASVAKGVQARARRDDVAVFVADTDEEPAVEAGLFRALAKQVDGLILCSPRSSAEELAAIAEDTNVVLINRGVPGLTGVIFDDEDAMRQAMAHLAALGHRRVAWVGGPEASWSSQHREAGLRVAAESRGVELVTVGSFAPTYEGGVAAADQAVATEATAVVAYNDLVAIGLLTRLHARGISVPDDLSVIGVDDIEMSRMAIPSLSTIRMPKQRSGQIAVEILLDLIAMPEMLPPIGRQSVLAGELIVRNSTGPAPSTRA